jgi:hypothetical protein
VKLRCDSSVGIATDYGLEGRDSIPGRGTASRPALKPTKPTIQRFKGSSSEEVKQPKRGADRSTRPSAEIKNGGAVYLLPHPSSWRGASLFELRDIRFKPQ